MSNNPKWKQKNWNEIMCLQYLLETKRREIDIYWKQIIILVSYEQYEELITTDKVWRHELESSTCGWCQNQFSQNQFDITAKHNPAYKYSSWFDIICFKLISSVKIVKSRPNELQISYNLSEYMKLHTTNYFNLRYKDLKFV